MTGIYFQIYYVMHTNPACILVRAIRLQNYFLVENFEHWQIFSMDPLNLACVYHERIFEKFM